MQAYTGPEIDFEIVMFLKKNGISPLPPSLRVGAAITRLKKNKIIEEDSVSDGVYKICGHAQEINVSLLDKFSLQRNSYYIDPIPTSEQQQLIKRAIQSSVDASKTGLYLGRPITEFDLAFLSERKRQKSSTAIWFLYPTGLPIKHIAWGLSDDYPLITEHSINTQRIYLGIKRRSEPFFISQKVLDEIYMLLDEGECHEKIEGFYGLSNYRVKAISASRKRR